MKNKPNTTNTNNEISKELEKANKTIEKLDENITILEEKLSKKEEDIKVLKADNINYRKRKDDELREKLKYANKDLILDIIPALDNFELALKGNMPKEALAYARGFEMIYRSLDNALKSYGVVEIDALNKKFDGKYHECLLVESDKNKADNMIIEVLRKGYILHDRVIRPAQVKVNKIEKEGEKNE